MDYVHIHLQTCYMKKEKRKMVKEIEYEIYHHATSNPFETFKLTQTGKSQKRDTESIINRTSCTFFMHGFWVYKLPHFPIIMSVTLSRVMFGRFCDIICIYICWEMFGFVFAVHNWNWPRTHRYRRSVDVRDGITYLNAPVTLDGIWLKPNKGMWFIDTLF